jgi:hypothetical protein
MEANWEMIQKRQGVAGRQEEGWKLKPCVLVYEKYLVLNVPFCAAFNISQGTMVNVFLDQERMKLGLQIALTPDETAHAYLVKPEYVKKGALATSFRVASVRLMNRIKDFAGSVYPASLVQGSRIIEVDLSAPEE